VCVCLRAVCVPGCVGVCPVLGCALDLKIPSCLQSPPPHHSAWVWVGVGVWILRHQVSWISGILLP
jgi:hypothetical protein